MTENALTIIRRLFVDRYDDLKARLTQRLGSADLAGDAMQDTWLRLSRAESIGAVQSPRSYLFRIALNVAEDRRRMERRQRISAIEIESLLELPDDAPTAEQTMLARSDLEAFEAIVDELPERRRVIFLAARVGNVPRQEIADRLGISRQLVAKELRLALEHCLARYKELKG
ncbi:sigma-70 family RNA polymerase sigma factor [Bradyrhizobium sp. 31Argb]|uniref:RNA polymerase sigma factor n=1 Tax=unclassified Bradyrhizobium TaxID=2631580 RepID=UPI00102E403D|nr:MULTISPECIES: sigma-70 family RNA polymerase sigma factor [unclassified Bradyrhizobium]MDI4235619.1 sigma-70 family RNA polymerase sigma factor [Bradyrhizobium sp. Arg237L]TAI65888.1 RNA polymerase subunit sigma-70 [Bradyrhizobium sp. Leo170]